MSPPNGGGAGALDTGPREMNPVAAKHQERSQASSGVGQNGAVAPADDYASMTPEQAEAKLRNEYPGRSGGTDYASRLAEQTEAILLHREAVRAADAADAPVLKWWDVDELLASPTPEPLLPGFLYRDSLARIFGPPGGGKTFLALDIALHVALGRTWWGTAVTAAAPVVYVAAEGQAVLNERVKAWLGHHHVTPAALRGRFVVVPHAVPMVEAPALDRFVARCRSLGAGLVVLDTKNAMMIGEENSATDVAAMRRAMDRVRDASRACVALVDHTGHSVTDRARGSSAVTAAMDTEVSVALTAEPGAPATVTATVTRDKAAVAGTERSFRLRMAPPAAVLVADTAPQRVLDPSWRTHPIPAELREATGTGATHVPALARYMAAYALGDTGDVGMTRSEALHGIGIVHNDRTGRQAWSRLIDGEWIEPADGVKSATGRHRWAVEQAPGITPLGSRDER